MGKFSIVGISNLSGPFSTLTISSVAIKPTNEKAVAN